MNQTRKIVPLVENDSAVSIAPIVGVWTAYDEIHDLPNANTNTSTNTSTDTADHVKHKNENNEYSNLRNPLTWAVMIRFLFNENIKDRVFISDETFLLVSPFYC